MYMYNKKPEQHEQRQHMLLLRVTVSIHFELLKRKLGFSTCSIEDKIFGFALEIRRYEYVQQK